MADAWTYGAKDVAKLLGVSRDKVYILVKQDKIPGLLFPEGRLLFSKWVIDKWLRGMDAE